MLLVDGGKHLLWRYPRPGHPPSMPFNFDDDAFFLPGWRGVISNQEEQQTIEEISFPGGRVTWHYGHVDAAGSSTGFLHTPDDAYVLRDGTVTVADVGNCRVLFISSHGHVERQLGTTDVCGHAPPRLLASPNGDTPMPGGGTLVTEIGGSWIDAIGSDGHLRWTVHAPVSYPSDAQPLGHGRILLVDHARPGRVLIIDRHGTVLWSYGPSSGPGMLDHPSLALMPERPDRGERRLPGPGRADRPRSAPDRLAVRSHGPAGPRPRVPRHARRDGLPPGPSGVAAPIGSPHDPLGGAALEPSEAVPALAVRRHDVHHGDQHAGREDHRAHHEDLGRDPDLHGAVHP